MPVLSQVEFKRAVEKLQEDIEIFLDAHETITDRPLQIAALIRTCAGLMGRIAPNKEFLGNILAGQCTLLMSQAARVFADKEDESDGPVAGSA